MVKTEGFYTAFAKSFVKKRSFCVLYKKQYGFLVIITFNSDRLAALSFFVGRRAVFVPSISLKLLTALSRI